MSHPPVKTEVHKIGLPTTFHGVVNPWTVVRLDLTFDYDDVVPIIARMPSESPLMIKIQAPDGEELNLQPWTGAMCQVYRGTYHIQIFNYDKNAHATPFTLLVYDGRYAPLA